MKSWLRTHLQSHKAYTSARSEFSASDRPMIYLDANENPYDWPYSRYPDPLQGDLKAAIGQWKKVPPSQLFLDNGSDAIIQLLIMGLCEPGEESILICPPTFGMYAVGAALLNIEVETVPLTPQFQLDVRAILDAVHPKMKLCFIPNPNNPSANWFSKTDLQTIAENFPGLLVIDEAYAEFSPDDSALSWALEYPNVMVLQTFSKAQGMAGARLGMGFTRETLINDLNTIKPPYNLNSLTIAAAMEQLQQQHRVQKQVEEMCAQREQLMKALTEMDWVHEVFPSAANFFLIRVDNSQQRYLQLLDHGIVVRNTSKKRYCENTLRITIGTPEENKQLIAAFKSLSS